MTKINTENWKEFRVGDIFICETTGGIPSKNDLIDGAIPYITRSAENNGLSGTCGNLNKIVAGNCITIGAEGFIAFYQANDFVAGNKVYAIRYENINKTNALFVCGALNALSHQYSFNNARTLDKIKNEIIKLPVTSSGEIDWNYIEEFMASCEGKASNNVERVRRGKAEPHSLVDTSDWGLFKTSELFKVEKIKNKLTKAEVSDNGFYPVYSSETTNGGIQGYINSDPEFIINKTPMLIFGDHTKAMNIATRSFNVMDNVKVLTPLFPATVNLLLFIISVWKACIPDLGYARHWSMASNLIIKLPISSDGSPNFAYMEDYIENLKRSVSMK